MAVINGVTWSLALEMQFYVALVLSVGWLVRLGAGKTLLMLTTIAWALAFWHHGGTATRAIHTASAGDLHHPVTGNAG
jgi:peptidoglycan/LPS O-acetylase OafA/YrhL